MCDRSPPGCVFIYSPATVDMYLAEDSSQGVFFPASAVEAE